VSADDIPLRIDVPRGNPTAEELAAVIAVAGAAYMQEASSAVADEGRQSAWHLSQRSLRRPLRRDLGWGRFGSDV
jgi:hypothetical protein